MSQVAEIVAHDRRNGYTARLEPAQLDSPSWLEPEDRGRATLSPLGDTQYVEDLIRPGRIVVCAAEEGTGKSMAVSGELSIRVAAAGGRFAETWPVLRKGPVLVLSEMHSDDDFQREELILESLGLTREALLGNYWRLPLMTAAGEVPALMDPRWRARTTEWCRDQGVLLAVFDTATGATQIDPWGKDIQAVYRGLRVMLEEYPELAIVLVVHMKKPQSRGGRSISDVLGEWGRWCDVLLTLERAGGGRIRLSTYKRVRQERSIEATKRNGLLVEPSDLAERSESSAAHRVAAAVKAEPGLTYAALGQRLKTSKDSASRWAKTATAAGLVVERRSGSRGAVQLFLPAAVAHEEIFESAANGSAADDLYVTEVGVNTTAAPPQTAANGLAAIAEGHLSHDHRTAASTYIGAAVRAAVVPSQPAVVAGEPIESPSFPCQGCGALLAEDGLCSDCWSASTECR